MLPPLSTTRYALLKNLTTLRKLTSLTCNNFYLHKIMLQVTMLSTSEPNSTNASYHPQLYIYTSTISPYKQSHPLLYFHSRLQRTLFHIFYPTCPLCCNYLTLHLLPSLRYILIKYLTNLCKPTPPLICNNYFNKINYSFIKVKSDANNLKPGQTNSRQPP